MATIVCQGLQSCLQEPQVVEPRLLRLKLSSPIPHHLFSATPLELGFKSFPLSESNHIKELSHEEKCHYDKPTTKNSDLGGWSFLQSISNNNFEQQNPPTPVYNKFSSSATRLNEKSLELCTENLGNETGTIFIENNIFETKGKSTVERDRSFCLLISGLYVYVKFSALFRVSRMPFPYGDLSNTLSQVVSSFGANRVMWGSDFPFVVAECGYKGAKEAVSLIANQIPLSSSELEWIDHFNIFK